MSDTQKNITTYALSVFIACLSFAMWTVILAKSYEQVWDVRGLSAAEVRPKIQQDFFRNAVPDTGNDADAWEVERKYALSIPSLDVYAPVMVPSKLFWDVQQWDLFERQMQVAMKQGVVAYPHSVQPGEDGVLVIAGHSSPPGETSTQNLYGKVFESLPNLADGDEIILRNEGADVTYVVRSSHVVPVDDTSVLAQTGGKGILKIITCFPIGTTKERLVITAEMSE